MRILAIERRPTTERGGSERSYFDVLTGLQARGHEVVLVYEEPGDLLDKYLDRGVTAVQASMPFLLRKGRRWADFKELLHTSRIAKRQGPIDVVYINFTEALPLAVLMKIRSGASIVCHIRVVYSGLTRQILWSARSVKRFIVINNKLKSTYETIFNTKKVDVVFNGIDIPKALPPTKTYSPRTEIRLLCLGRIAPEKGISEMAGAFGNAIRKGLKATLQITGSYVASHSGDYKVELAQAIDESGVKDLIRISPSENNPIDYIAGFDLFIFPSIWDEPFGRTLPETILAGTPVLARNVGMVSDIMVDNPHFLFDTDEQLTTKLMEFYNGTLTFDIEAARKTITEKFNKGHMIDGVEKVLETVSKQK
jgi:glycosyltransferase involved in cell wall biosynthesis